MNDMTSTEFRKRFSRLVDQTIVTANGHAIGVWVPTRISQEFVQAMLGPAPEGALSVPAHIDPTLPRLTQAQRDEILHKINRGK